MLLAIIFIWCLVVCKLRKEIRWLYLLLMQVGLFLMLFGAGLDFTDEFKNLNGVFIVGRSHYLHDFLEDQIGATLGFLIFGVSFVRGVLKKGCNERGEMKDVR